eukprot:3020035-Amphidinium_carterae.1
MPDLPTQVQPTSALDWMTGMKMSRRIGDLRSCKVIVQKVWLLQFALPLARADSELTMRPVSHP